MIKYLSHCLFLGILCTGMQLRAQEVEISIDHPDQVKAGEEFTVNVIINKGSLTDYSRFSQDLPLGLTAINVHSPNADFSFDNQRVRIIWLKLPDEEEVQVSYKIMVDKRLKGSFILGGVFAYVVEDERKFLNFDRSREISIAPNPEVDPSLVVDIKDFKGASSLATASRQPSSGLMVIRQKPVLMNSGAYRVRLMVRNPDGSKYVKIEESIPSGYLFEEVSSGDGIVSHAASTVKFIWMKLPDRPVFEVVYDLIPKRDEAQGEMNIDGEITYTSDDENLVTGVVQMDVALDALSSDQKRELLASGTIPRGTPKSSAASAPSKASGESSTPERIPSQSAERQASQPAASSGRSVPATASGGQIMGTPVLTGGSGLYFRVQVSANQQAIDAGTHYRVAGIDREIAVERHEGMYKYTAGSFRTYGEAVAYRDRVENLPDVEGAFVVAYRDGNRIPISSARR